MNRVRLTQTHLAHIQSLEGKDGRLSARKLLTDAKRPTSPLHALYNWDVRHAAEQYWLERSQRILASVAMQITVNHAVVMRPVYAIDLSVKGGGHRNVVALRHDRGAARESLIYTLEVAAGHLRRAYDLAQPLGLVNEIDALLAQVAGVKMIVEKKTAA